MANRWLGYSFSFAIFIAASFSVATQIAAAAESGRLLTGKAATGDWTADAPGVRRKIAVNDLPAPSSNVFAINRARVVDRPANAQPQVPPGFRIELYASGFRDPRFLLTAPNGDTFVVESRANQIKVLRDTKGSGKPDANEIFAERDLNKPFGVAFYPPGNDPQFLYVANTDGVIRFPYRNGDLKARGPAENERDELGDDLPPDYISSVKPGGFYGWPWFYIGNHVDPVHKGKHLDLANKVIVPDVLVQSHSATLNLCFYTGEQFPPEYKGDIFAAFHGSWNRTKRTGYKLVRVQFDHSTGKTRGEYEDFVTGFVTPEGKVWGRPVGITVTKDGGLLISEDGNGTN